MCEQEKIHEHFLRNWALANPRQILEDNIKMVPIQTVH
jgi:hypothetical protein